MAGMRSGRSREPGVRPCRQRRARPAPGSGPGQALHVAVARPALTATAIAHLIAVYHPAGRNRILLRTPRIERREVRRGRLHQLTEAVDHEVRLLLDRTRTRLHYSH